MASQSQLRKVILVANKSMKRKPKEGSKAEERSESKAKENREIKAGKSRGYK